MITGLLLQENARHSQTKFNINEEWGLLFFTVGERSVMMRWERQFKERRESLLRQRCSGVAG